MTLLSISVRKYIYGVSLPDGRVGFWSKKENSFLTVSQDRYRCLVIVIAVFGGAVRAVSGIFVAPSSKLCISS